jgi:uncharacterized protein YqgV (UPF0045/DUF77 family)
MNLADIFAFIAMVVSMATVVIALVQEDKQLRETINVAQEFARNNYILQNKLNNQLANMQTIINANLEAVLSTEEEAEKISKQFDSMNRKLEMLERNVKNSYMIITQATIKEKKNENL